MYRGFIRPNDQEEWRKLRGEKYDAQLDLIKKIKELGIRDDLRFIFSPVRGGSTPLMMTFLNNGNVRKAHYQPIKGGLRSNGELDYSIYLNHASSEKNGSLEGSKKIEVVKETFGPFSIEESAFNPIPPILQEELKDLIDKIRPLFLFRDPHQILAAMENREWDKTMGKILAEEAGHKWSELKKEDKKSFFIAGKERILKHLETSYRQLFQTFEMMRNISNRVACVTYGHIGGVADNIDQEIVLRAICHHWGIRYDSQMTDWKLLFDDVVKKNIPNDERKFITTPDFYKLYKTEAFSNLSGATSFVPIEKKLLILGEDLEFISRKGLDACYRTARKRSQEFVAEARKKGLKDEKDEGDEKDEKGES